MIRLHLHTSPMQRENVRVKLQYVKRDETHDTIGTIHCSRIVYFRLLDALKSQFAISTTGKISHTPAE
jgi:hypothetical protein